MSRRLVLTVVVTLLVVVFPQVALAGPPVDDEELRDLPTGGVEGEGVSWEGYADLAPTEPLLQLTTMPAGWGPGDGLGWLGLKVDPGKWVSDAAVGSLTGTVLTFNGILWQLVSYSLGQPIEDPFGGGTVSPPAGMDFGGFVLQTPASWTYENSTITSMVEVARALSHTLLALFVTLSLLGLIAPNNPLLPKPKPQQVVGSLLAATVMLRGGLWLCGQLIELSNALCHSLVGDSLGNPMNEVLRLATTQPSDGMSLSLAVIGTLLLLVILVFSVINFFRIVILNIQLIVAPLAGACLAFPGAAGVFKNWGQKLLTTVITQITWVLGLSLAFRWLLDAFSGGLTHPFIGAAMGVITIVLALALPKYIGLAGGSGAAGALGLVAGIRASGQVVQAAARAGARVAQGSARGTIALVQRAQGQRPRQSSHGEQAGLQPIPEGSTIRHERRVSQRQEAGEGEQISGGSSQRSIRWKVTSSDDSPSASRSSSRPVPHRSTSAAAAASERGLSAARRRRLQADSEED